MLATKPLIDHSVTPNQKWAVLTTYCCGTRSDGHFLYIFRTHWYGTSSQTFLVSMECNQNRVRRIIAEATWTNNNNDSSSRKSQESDARNTTHECEFQQPFQIAPYLNLLGGKILGISVIHCLRNKMDTGRLRRFFLAWAKLLTKWCSYYGGS